MLLQKLVATFFGYYINSATWFELIEFDIAFLSLKLKKKTRL